MYAIESLVRTRKVWARRAAGVERPMCGAVFVDDVQSTIVVGACKLPRHPTSRSGRGVGRGNGQYSDSLGAGMAIEVFGSPLETPTNPPLHFTASSIKTSSKLTRNSPFGTATFYLPHKAIPYKPETPTYQNKQETLHVIRSQRAVAHEPPRHRTYYSVDSVN
jgi:hypothetical protein